MSNAARSEVSGEVVLMKHTGEGRSPWIVSILDSATMYGTRQSALIETIGLISEPSTNILGLKFALGDHGLSFRIVMPVTKP